MFPFLLNMSMIGGSLTLEMAKAEKAIVLCAVCCGEGLEPSLVRRCRIDGYVVRITRR